MSTHSHAAPSERLHFFDVLGRLDDLAPSHDEVLDHGGRMLDELHAAAVDAGRLPEMWRALPLWTAADVDRIRAGIVAERAELADDEAVEGVDPDYTVEHRRCSPFEFDVRQGYIRVGAEVRVREGLREPVVTVGGIDFALTDAPLLASAVLAMYHALVDAEGLQIGIVEG